MMNWKSLAEWPAGTICTGRTDNITEDWHHSREDAEGVCKMLEQFGFGGDGEIFPVSTWTEKVEEKV